ncbi:MAG TPA: hypothetical protein VGZ73_09000 [Bryobacteraceae bacterium]|jgi:hypothetical protein|nr:hypothetical protein [Bryobacteraceae bacterium]
MTIRKDEKSVPKKTNPATDNRDPISGEKGAHPVGVGVGTAVGGGVAGGALGAAGAALAAGAAGAAAGPVGAVVGAVAGGIIGAAAGKEVAEHINPTLEDTYWRENYRNRPYVEEDIEYDEYQPAYQYGWESRTVYSGRTFDEAEPELENGWKTGSRSKLTWDQVKHAVRDAWDRVDSASATRRARASRTQSKKS